MLEPPPRWKFMTSYLLMNNNDPDNIPPVAHRRMVGKFCHCWAMGGFWLYNKQFATVWPTVAFQPIFMSVELSNGGPPLGFVQDSGEQ